jgi:hypothetical protein
MGTTFLKRQKEMKRMEKQRAKAERRAQKKLAGRTQLDEFGNEIPATDNESSTDQEDVSSETSSPV